MTSESCDSARARLIKTRRGTWIDESLLPAACRECLEILREAAREAAGGDEYTPGWLFEVLEEVDYKAGYVWTGWEGPEPSSAGKEIDDTIEALVNRGAFEGLSIGEQASFLSFIHESIASRHASQENREVRDVLVEASYDLTGHRKPPTEKQIFDLLINELGEHGVLGSIIEADTLRSPVEENDAWELACEARKTAEMCGCCGRDLPFEEPAYLGAEVYVGMYSLYWDRVSKPRICKLRYEQHGALRVVRAGVVIAGEG